MLSLSFEDAENRPCYEATTHGQYEMMYWNRLCSEIEEKMSGVTGVGT